MRGECLPDSDGRNRFLLVRRTVLTLHGGDRVTVGVVADVTALKEMEAKLRRLATTDPLTQGHNRRRFLELATVEYHRASRFSRPLAVLMIDIDRFKAVNDTQGHATGDAVIRTVAATAVAMLRKVDVFGQLGGEEFAAILWKPIQRARVMPPANACVKQWKKASYQAMTAASYAARSRLARQSPTPSTPILKPSFTAPIRLFMKPNAPAAIAWW